MRASRRGSGSGSGASMMPLESWNHSASPAPQQQQALPHPLLLGDNLVLPDGRLSASNSSADLLALLDGGTNSYGGSGSIRGVISRRSVASAAFHLPPLLCHLPSGFLSYCATFVSRDVHMELLWGFYVRIELWKETAAEAEEAVTGAAAEAAAGSMPAAGCDSDEAPLSALEEARFHFPYLFLS